MQAKYELFPLSAGWLSLGVTAKGGVNSPFEIKDPLWGSLKYSRDRCLTPGNWIWFKPLQMAAVILHLVSKGPG